LSTNIDITLRGFDKASDVIKGVSDKIVGTQETVRTANNKVDKSGKDVAISFNNIATSGLALYNSVDRVQSSQVALDRANLGVKSSANAVADAQRKYNATVEKFGVNSEEAAIASDDLKLAQERYEVACSRADIAQGNVSQAMMSAAVTVIPSLITMITSISTITAGWTTITKGASSALLFLQANPIVLVVTAIVGLIALLITAYETCEPFRNAINAIANVLGGALSTAANAIYGVLQDLWDNVFRPLGTWITEVFIGAWKGLVDFYNQVLKPIIDTVGKWFKDVWDNVLAPLGTFLKDTLLGAWQALCNGWEAAYNTVLKPVFDALTTFYNVIIKPIQDFFGGIAKGISDWWGGVTGGGTPSNEMPNTGGRLQHGGLVTKPMFGLIGEAGPEVVIPLSNLGNFMQPPAPIDITIPQFGTTVIIEINAPMVNVEGSADLRTVRMCANLIKDSLKNVVIEATSVNAPTGQSQIRIGSSTLGSVGYRPVGGLYNWKRSGKMGGPQP